MLITVLVSLPLSSLCLSALLSVCLYPCLCLSVCLSVCLSLSLSLSSLLLPIFERPSYPVSHCDVLNALQSSGKFPIDISSQELCSSGIDKGCLKVSIFLSGPILVRSKFSWWEFPFLFLFSLIGVSTFCLSLVRWRLFLSVSVLSIFKQHSESNTRSV